MDAGNMTKSGFSFIKNLLSKLKNGKLKNILVVVLVVAVVLIFTSTFTSTKTSSNKTTEENYNINSSALEYCLAIENKLENVLSSVKGISNVKVFVSVSEGPRIEYLEEKNNTKTTDGDKTTETNQQSVFEQKVDGDTKPVMVIETLPEIKGVLIIAKGADVKMQTTLANIVSSVLSVSVSKVEVMEGK